MDRHEHNDHEHGGPHDQGDVEFPAGSLFPMIHTEGDAGVPYQGGRVLPNDGDVHRAAPGASGGSLGTSGRDDQLRGETVSGIGIDPETGQPRQMREPSPLASPTPVKEHEHEGDLPGELGRDAGASSKVR